ncbi:hypothetical protein CTI12_AA183640 [Artemisia annua]|uniref:Retrotransposon Copia-like N-terminal domain-containing protein n=1 Tax=Artemisia annua TaxID=35608 RepID=A0A2U1P814_ARTAN|nr:hypothetical protein CTI12_AA183640 [Artemisia annua]
MTTPDPTPPAIFQNPIYLHPSDGPGSLTVQEKLIGAQNYRAWRRAIEIGISTKRKLGFIKGTVVRSNTDANLVELWDTCNNMVICWIMGSVSESIARSIMFVGTASEIWMQLVRRFSLSDGSRKYKLNKDTYEITQSGGSVGEYYTKMKCVWEELDNLNVLPVITLFTKGGMKDSVSNGKCSICGFKWHPPERCWEKVGYPAWHPKHRGSQAKQIKPVQGRNPNVTRTVAHVESGNISFTPQQFEQLMKSVQQMGAYSGGDEDFDHQFAAGIACLNSQLDLLELLHDWIYDTGASDHMTPEDENIIDPYQLQIKPQIKLPNSDTSVISHVGKVKLNNGTLNSVNKVDSGQYALWHHRLGHLSDSKLKHMNELPVSVSKTIDEVCLTCPMAKFSKLPYALSDSHSSDNVVPESQPTTSVEVPPDIVHEAPTLPENILEKGTYLSKTGFRVLERCLLEMGDEVRLKKLDKMIKKLQIAVPVSRGHAMVCCSRPPETLSVLRLKEFI